MSKLTNVRERVHQPFRDSLVRTSGYSTGAVQDRTDLFTLPGRSKGATNLVNGATLPSDQSFVTLALRVKLWFRNSQARSVADIDNTAEQNGDFFITAANEAQAAQILDGSAPGDVRDVHRLYYQAGEQLLWSFGTGLKDSIESMPSSYFPWGGGLHGQLGGSTDLIFWNNGMPSQAAITRLARAILLPPRQNIRCRGEISALTAGGNAAVFLSNQGSRNMLSLVDNLNAADLIQKAIHFAFDGLFSRDVQ